MVFDKVDVNLDSGKCVFATLKGLIAKNMIYFFISMPLNEVLNIEDKLPRASYCLMQLQSTSSRYYGIMKKDAYAAFVLLLSEDTKKNLETLEKNIFQMFFLQNISDSITFLGNRRLMMYLSDEN